MICCFAVSFYSFIMQGVWKVPKLVDIFRLNRDINIVPLPNII